MKYIRFTSLFTALALAAGMSSCGDKNDDPTPVKPDPGITEAPRTVLVYMVAENNLSYNSTKDINEMTQAALAGDLGDSRLIVYQDHKNNPPTLSEIKSDGSRDTIKIYDDATLSVDPKRLAEVITDSRSAAPARRYGIIFWGHGTGYVENEITPLSYGGETAGKASYWMKNTTLASALDGRGFDWIYFDCCFMSSIESVYELRHAADYIVGSATELPADGMPYHKTLRYLMPYDSDLTGAANSTFSHYDNFYGASRTCTMSVIHTSALDNLAEAVRAVYTSTSGLPAGYEPQAFQTDNDRTKYGWEYYDLLHYAKALAGDNTAALTRLETAFSDAVISAYATPMLWNDVPLVNHNGLATLIVESTDSPLLDRFNYRELSWWRDVVAKRFD